MPTSPMSGIIHPLRRAALLGDEGGLSDGQLLECFVRHRDESAFTALPRRHGPIVVGVLVSPAAVRLMKGAVKAMLLARVKIAAVVLSVGLLGAGAGLLGHRAMADKPASPPATGKASEGAAKAATEVRGVIRAVDAARRTVTI